MGNTGSTSTVSDDTFEKKSRLEKVRSAIRRSISKPSTKEEDMKQKNSEDKANNNAVSKL